MDRGAVATCAVFGLTRHVLRDLPDKQRRQRRVVYEGSDSKGSSVNTSDSEDEQDDIDSDGPDDTGNHDADAAEAPVAPMSNHAQALAVVNSVVPSLAQPPWL